jgi:magnesium-protoporphyrin IX monomethyl ester (oxidative) cyclase
MPFAEVHRPSLALSLLKSALTRADIESEVIYGNFHFAETIGLVAYQAMQSAPTDHLIGEWCFADLLFPEGPKKDEEYLSLVLEVRCQGFPAELEQRIDLMRWVRAQAADHIDWLARQIVARNPRIVGCSSVFQQHCASLALLKQIRHLNPDTVLIMGGANCEGEMGQETVKNFPWVDCVVSGEADEMFAELCRVLLDRGHAAEPSQLPHGAIPQGRSCNVLPIMSETTCPAPRLVVHDLDALPVPDYHDYFLALMKSTLSELVQPELLAESSRGCWWGEKSHCTFCGLNGSGMKHRSKSPTRVLSEISELTEVYGDHHIQFVDNILDMSYFKTVLPRLAALDEKFSIFYETKANLKREEVRLLAEAGVRWIQPGIESMDDNLLRLIGKGCSTLINLQLLKWAGEFGIHADWNLLCGIPGEVDDWYAEMAKWLPAIFHLQPPSGVNRVRFDRFSPYHMRPHEFGLTLQPTRAYAYVYPLPEEALMRLACSFEEKANHRHVHRAMHTEPGQRQLQEVVQEWNQLWHTSRPVLWVDDDGTRMRFVDTRSIARQQSWTAGELEAEVYRACDYARSPAAVIQHISMTQEADASVEDIQSAIHTLCEAKLLLSINGKLISVGVAVPNKSQRFDSLSSALTTGLRA